MTYKKPQKLKARLPSGLADRGPAEIAATQRMIEAIRAVYERYGFEPVETPAIEYTDALGKFLPDQDRPNEGVFSFQDDDEQWLSLRYDLTAPLARHFAENFQDLARPYRSYRVGYVFRNEKPGPGRFRQFMQFDADTVGSASPAADAEMCMMAADAMEALGVKRGDYVVKVNSRKVLDGVMAAVGIEDERTKLTVLRAIDKLDRLGANGVRQLLGQGRRDESGDFTKGAGLHENVVDLLTLLFRPGQGSPRVPIDMLNKVPRSHIGQAELDRTFIREEEFAESNYLAIDLFAYVTHDLLAKNGFQSNDTLDAGLSELIEIGRLVDAAGYARDRILVDPSVVRGLEYYTGAVFEVELTFETKDEKGRPTRFGSVGGGGRYDGLVSRFRGEPVPATGFSIGVSRLRAALEVIKSPIVSNKKSLGPVLVTVLDFERVPDYQRMTKALRNAGIRAELYLGGRNHNLTQQLKYADKRNSPCAIIQGTNEKQNPEGPFVIVKDLVVGTQLANPLTERDEYLRTQTAAQIIVREEELVRAVSHVLRTHGVRAEKQKLSLQGFDYEFAYKHVVQRANFAMRTIILQAQRLNRNEPEDADFSLRKVSDSQFLNMALAQLRRIAISAIEIPPIASKIKHSLDQFDRRLPNLKYMNDVDDVFEETLIERAFPFEMHNQTVAIDELIDPLRYSTEIDTHTVFIAAQDLFDDILGAHIALRATHF